MGNYDAIIIGHSQFERIPISDERQEAMLRKQIDNLEMFNKCQYLDEITGGKGITFKAFAYRHIGRHLMNRNVRKIRER